MKTRLNKFYSIIWILILIIVTPLKVQSQTALTALPSAEGTFICPPCGCSSDDSVFHEAGTCPSCPMKLQNEQKKINVAIFIFDGMEILDFSGPAEVFAAAKSEKGWFNAYTVGVDNNPITSQGFVQIKPEYSIENSPRPDVLVLPGGSVGNAMNNKAVIRWVKEASKNWTVGMSVCNGAFILAETGLLDGKKATTFHGLLEDFDKNYPKIEVLRETRYVDNGSIITTAGVSAGIDGALQVVTNLLGEKTAQRAVEYMEYDNWKPEAGLVVSRKE